MKLLGKQVEQILSIGKGTGSSATNFTPMGLVVGSRKTYGDDPLEVAYNSIADSLDNDEVKIIHKLHGDTVYFIGAAAREFVNVQSGRITSPLALALLDPPSESNNGAVTTPTESGGHAAIIRKNGSLSVFSGNAEDTQKFVNTHNVEMLSRIDEDSKEPRELPHWIGFNQSQTAETRRIGIVMVVCLLLWAAAMASVGLVSSYRAATNVEKLSSFRHKSVEAIRSAVIQMKSSGRRNETVLDEFQVLTTMVVKAKGKIIKFQARDGRIEYWKVEVPEYTPANAYAGLLIDTAEKTDGKLFLSKGREY